MKISISYPPIESKKGVPLISQNRQFQWFNSPTYIYPVVPAYGATLLKKRGYDVFWDDGIAENLTYDHWFKRICIEKPDVVVIESKTPVVKYHWKIINELKALSSGFKLIMVGDHVTALPRESMENCHVDYVVTGGDYDFVLADLCDWLSGESANNPANHPVNLKTKLQLPKGIWYRENGEIMNTGLADMGHDLNNLPIIDRELSRWELYAYKNGNFKFTPGTYVMTGRDCWWGRCSFCSWTTLYPGRTYRTVSVERHVEEVGRLITDYKVREIFDDSGCFPKGAWLEEFCKAIIDKGYHKKVVLGCNMRVGALTNDQWKLMKKANFRFILIGLESVSQATLERLKKGINVEQIEKTIKDCKAAGLEPHITTMVGYPWESRKDAEQTISFAKRMFTKGFLDTLQATIVVPYPGTPMFEEAKQNDWLVTENWDDYDMKQSVWKSPITNEDVLEFTQGLYRAALSPSFIARKVFSIRNIDDIKFLARATLKVFAHIADFKNNNDKCKNGHLI
jgi:radical SAM superfamily enzyme YgiQ (UPF0313 family)